MKTADRGFDQPAALIAIFVGKRPELKGTSN